MPSDLINLAKGLPLAMESPAWLDDSLFKLYLYCLSRASHNTYVWRGRKLQPGDMPLSERHVAEALAWSRNKLLRKLKEMQEAGVISLNVIPGKGTILHITDWPQNGNTGNQQLQNEAQSWNQMSRMEPLTEPQAEPQMEPLTEPQAEPQMEPQAKPQTEPQRYQNGASGSKTGPNPIEDNNTSTNTLSSTAACQMEPAGFQSFWIAYPLSRRNQRAEAAALVRQAYRDGATSDSLMAALEADKNSEGWQLENGRFIPGIVKWLQKEAWRGFVQASEEDEEEWETH